MHTCRHFIRCRYCPYITAAWVNCTDSAAPSSQHPQITHTHCQMIQRGDQSEAPFQHTLRGRVVKQSTVCIICTASHFSFFLFDASLFPICQTLYHRVFNVVVGRQDFFFFLISMDQVTGQHWHWPIWISLIFIWHEILLKWVMLIWFDIKKM